jgi:hypothetical protein
MEEEYYMIEATLSTGATKYLILRDMPSIGLVIYDKWDDKKGAMAHLAQLNEEAR